MEEPLEAGEATSRSDRTRMAEDAALVASSFKRAITLTSVAPSPLFSYLPRSLPPLAASLRSPSITPSLPIPPALAGVHAFFSLPSSDRPGIRYPPILPRQLLPCARRFTSPLPRCSLRAPSYLADPLLLFTSLARYAFVRPSSLPIYIPVTGLSFFPPFLPASLPPSFFLPSSSSPPFFSLSLY